MTDSRITTLITQLKAMERLTRTEVQVARSRVAQARTPFPTCWLPPPRASSRC
jgi:hypothetical protein